MKLKDEDKELDAKFHGAVNMAPKELDRWLEQEESKRVGFKADGDDESIGHASGRYMIEIMRKKQGDYTPDDLAHMRKVIGYIHRHLAQRPKGDVTETNWRYSLMNWGHDPLK